MKRVNIDTEEKRRKKWEEEQASICHECKSDRSHYKNKIEHKWGGFKIRKYKNYICYNCDAEWRIYEDENFKVSPDIWIVPVVLVLLAIFIGAIVCFATARISIAITLIAVFIAIIFIVDAILEEPK